MVNAHCAVCLVGTYNISTLYMHFCIKAGPGGSQQMLNGCFVLSTSGAFQLEGDIK